MYELQSTSLKQGFGDEGNPTTEKLRGPFFAEHCETNPFSEVFLALIGKSSSTANGTCQGLFLDVGYRPEAEDVFLTAKEGVDPRALVLPFAHVHEQAALGRISRFLESREPS